MDISAELAEISSYEGFFALTVGGDAAGMASDQPVLRRRLRRFDRRHRPALPHHRTCGSAPRWSISATPRGCGHPCSRARWATASFRISDGPATCRRRGAAANARTRRSGRRLPISGRVVPHRRATTHGTARRRSAGQAGARPAGGQHRVRARRGVPGVAFGAAGPAQPDRRRSPTSLLGTGMLAGSGAITGPHLGFRRRSCCLFYRIPGRSVCGDCVFDSTGLDRASRYGAETAVGCSSTGPPGRRLDRPMNPAAITIARGARRSRRTTPARHRGARHRPRSPGRRFGRRVPSARDRPAPMRRIRCRIAGPPAR